MVENKFTAPDFLIVGAMKAGTTALADYLRSRDDIFIPLLKEPFFLVDRRRMFEFPYLTKPSSVKNGPSTFEEYAKLFDGSDGKICGEASAQYLPDPASPDKAYNINPNLKIIISLREPVSRAYSAYTYSQMKGFEGSRTFNDVVTEEFQGKRDAYFYEFQYLRSSLYLDNVTRWLEKFGRENVLIIFNEDIRRAETLREVLQFLGANPDDLKRVEDSNVSFVPRNFLHRYFWRVIESNSIPKRIALKIFPRKVLKPLQKKASQYISSKGQKPDKLDPVMSEKLRDVFRDDLAGLERYLRNLGYAKLPDWLTSSH